MKTYFAPAERLDIEKLNTQIEVVVNNPVIDGILRSVIGYLAVLNKQRQVVAVNNSLCEMLGAEDKSAFLGLRPGEMIRCIHAAEEPGGCGTSKYCSTCGAAIAITTCLAENETVERKCAITTEETGNGRELCLLVQCSPITVDGDGYLLLFIRDLTDYERWASLEKIFFHDINNLIFAMVGASSVLKPSADPDSRAMLQLIRQVSFRLANEVSLQRSLLDAKHHEYQLEAQSIYVKYIIDELNDTMKTHPAARRRKFTLPEAVPHIIIQTDITVLLRILTNMLINAFEASGQDDEVKLMALSDEETITFQVWNRQKISEELSRRIFQRYFTTKEGSGRGLGTYSMKFLGEEILQGKVDFSSSEEDGTTFSLKLPISGKAEKQGVTH